MVLVGLALALQVDSYSRSHHIPCWLHAVAAVTVSRSDTALLFYMRSSVGNTRLLHDVGMMMLLPGVQL
jgi:hypothetical protein